MVTHDVQMKAFADRVVWMRDGKIVRIESISKEAQDSRYEVLGEELERLTKGKTTAAYAKAHSGHNTQLRMPTDYATHPKHVERELGIFSFEEMTQEKYEYLVNPLINGEMSSRDFDIETGGTRNEFKNNSMVELDEIY